MKKENECEGNCKDCTQPRYNTYAIVKSPCKFKTKEQANTLNKHLTEEQIEVMRNHGIGLKAVCEWWLTKYPKDIFIGKTRGVKLIVEIRERMEEILKLGK